MENDTNLKILITDYPILSAFYSLNLSHGNRLRFSRHPPPPIGSDGYLSRELQQNLCCELARFPSVIFNANIYTAECVCTALCCAALCQVTIDIKTQR